MGSRPKSKKRLARGVIVPMRLFFFSLIYLTMLFAAVALDVLIG